ncbi:MAG: sugar phosphate isomerase/epimerase [Clostridia bacterium]|nr:sugar phosphate isomerase/epimerase [Clostridia bacterium]
MKIGNLILFNSLETIEEKFKIQNNSGFNSCQLCCWNMSFLTDEVAEFIKALCKKYNVEISAFWCGWSGPAVWNFYDGPKTLGLVPAEYREMRVKELMLGCDFAEKIGVTDIATHMGFIPEDPNDPNFKPFCDAVRAVAEYAKSKNLWLLFETGQETPTAMLRCFEEVGTDNLGVNLDTANLILYGKANPVDALDVFGKYVRNLHAKDGCYPTNGKELGRETKIGEGKVDFKALFKKLKELGYDSDVTIEREIGGEQQLIDVNESKKYLEKMIEEA